MSSLLSKLRQSPLNSVAALKEAKAKASATPSYKEDEARFWKLTPKKDGTGAAVIRFLPNKNVDELPYVKTYRHAFKGPTGKWLFENCPTTLGLSCPICAKNSENFNSGDEKRQQLARNRKRKMEYIANIYVISDPQNPENEGKVFLYKFGKKILDKIDALLTPEFEDEAPINAFDVFGGAAFRLKMKKVMDFPNYDDSSFAQPSAFLSGDEDALEKVLDKLYDLGEFVDPTRFKTEEQLTSAYNRVVHGSENVASSAQRVAVDADGDDAEVDTKPKIRATRPVDTDDDDDVASQRARINKLLEDDDDIPF